MNQLTNLSELEARLASLEAELKQHNQKCNEARERLNNAVGEWADVDRRIREVKQMMQVEKLVAQRMNEAA